MKYRTFKFPKAVTSLWTRTTAHKLHRGQLCVLTHAILQARGLFHTLEFVTDSKGAELARIMEWPFDNVVTALEDFDHEGLDHVWALGKLEAMRIQTSPFIQFDGDVLMNQQLPYALYGARLIAESPDLPWVYECDGIRPVYEASGLPKSAIKYNAGVIGGFDFASVASWATYGLSVARQFRHLPYSGTAVSMVAEQVSLGAFAGEHCIPVTCLRPVMPRRPDLARGYAHLWGHAKRDPKLCAEVETRLKTLHPTAHSAFERGWAKLNQP